MKQVIDLLDTYVNWPISTRDEIAKKLYIGIIDEFNKMRLSEEKKNEHLRNILCLFISFNQCSDMLEKEFIEKILGKELRIESFFTIKNDGFTGDFLDQMRTWFRSLSGALFYSIFRFGCLLITEKGSYTKDELRMLSLIFDWDPNKVHKYYTF